MQESASRTGNFGHQLPVPRNDVLQNDSPAVICKAFQEYQGILEVISAEKQQEGSPCFG